MRKKITPDQEKFICENYLTMTSLDLAKKFNLPKGTIMSCWKRNGITIPEELRKQRKADGVRRVRALIDAAPHPCDQAIRDNYLTVPVKRLATQLQVGDTWLNHRLAVLGLIIPPEIIAQRKLDSRRKPGDIPVNKGKKQVEFMSPEAIERTKATRFKKGEKNHNELYDGCIRIRHDHPERNGGRPVKWIRLSKGKWQELQRYNWEKVNGPIPKGVILTCIDGDTLNCDVSNWRLMSMADNAIRNSASTSLTDGYVINAIAGGQYRSNKEFKEAIASQPDLVEVKRLQLQLKRTLKKQQNERK